MTPTVEVNKRAAAAGVGAALDGVLQLPAEVLHQLRPVYIAQLCNKSNAAILILFAFIYR